MSEAAAPALYGRAPKARWFRREGEFVVVRTGAVLPARCVRTNQPAQAGDGLKEREFAWRPKWVKAVVPLLWGSLALVMWKPFPQLLDGVKAALIPLMLVCVSQQKRVKLTLCLSSRERRRGYIAQTVAAIAAIAGIQLVHLMGDWRDWLGVPLYIGGAFAMHFVSQRFPLRVVRHQDGEFWLKGASPAFLDSLES